MKVNISGTIGKDKIADSGLDDIGDKMNVNRLTRIAVVGIIEYHGHHEVVGRPESITVRFAAIEPLSGKDDTTARHLLDKARRGRGVGSTELTLFDDLPDAGTGPWPGDPGYKAPGEVVGDPFKTADDADKGTLSDDAYELSKVRGRVVDINDELEKLTSPADGATIDATTPAAQPAEKAAKPRGTRAKAKTTEAADGAPAEPESPAQKARRAGRRAGTLTSVPSGDDAA